MIVQFLRDVISAGLGIFGAFIFILLALSNEVGFRLGTWRSRRDSPSEKKIAAVSTITTGMLGLMAFLLALAINFSQDRFEARRHSTVEEANAIGTALLRTGLSEGAKPIAALIEEYARVRLAYLEATTQVAEAAASAQTNALQAQIWHLALAQVPSIPPPLAASFLASLNDMFDSSLSETYAIEGRVPVETMLILLCSALLVVGALGYQLGMGGYRQVVLGLLLLVMLSGGMVMIVDLSQPRLGFSRVDTAPLVWTIRGFAPASK